MSVERNSTKRRMVIGGNGNQKSGFGGSPFTDFQIVNDEGDDLKKGDKDEEAKARKSDEDKQKDQEIPQGRDLEEEEEDDESSEESDEDDEERGKRDERGSEEDEEDEEDEGEEDEEEAEVNRYLAFASELKADGYLSEEDLKDVDPDEFDGATLYEKFVSGLERKVRPNIENEVKQELISKGYNDQDLYYARAIRSGVNIQDLNHLSAYERLASVPEESDVNIKLQVIQQGMQHRNLSKDEIEVSIDRIKDNEEAIDRLFKSSKQYFQDQYKKSYDKQAAQIKAQDARAAEARKKAKQIVDTTFKTRKIKDIELTEDQVGILDSGLKEPSERVTDANGQTHTVTKYQAFWHSLQNDPEMQLWMFSKYLLAGDERDTAEERGKRKAERDFLRTRKSKKVKNSKKNKQGSDSPGKKRFVIERSNV